MFDSFKENRWSLIFNITSLHLAEKDYKEFPGGKIPPRKTPIPEGLRGKGVLKELNQNNYGLGAEYRLSDRFHLSGGGFKNGLDRNAYYLTAEVETDPKAFFGVGGGIGGITGYKIDPKDLSPSFIAFLYGRVGPRDGVNLKVSAVPTSDLDKVQAISFQLRVPIPGT